ncbi:MAG UNVERIFIED_CONTAM: hypothetical protein LVR29_26030 [Microcystis novacekii LVE1205-3]
MEIRKYSPNPQIEVCLSQWRYFSEYLYLVQIWDAPLATGKTKKGEH